MRNAPWPMVVGIALLPTCFEVQAVTLASAHVSIEIADDAAITAVMDRAAGASVLDVERAGKFAWVRMADGVVGASVAERTDDRLTLSFGDSGTATLGITEHTGYIELDVLAVDVPGIEELSFIDIPLATQGTLEEPFAACVLALNLQTHVRELPGPNRLLRASCYPKTGLAGAKAAIIACPTESMRSILQEAVSAAEGVPHSPVGGPWALDGPINRSSYVFNFDGVNEESVDEWIAIVQSLGFNQVQFHGGSSFRFGDCRLNPDRYPEGVASLRRVIDRLHEAGIYAGMQPYAFFIDKRCPWVTPVPDPGLAKDATFTLAEGLSAEAVDVPVVEPTEAMSTTTGFFVRNSVTLQIDDELIIYTGILKEAPYAFTQCQRGALGTQAAPHEAGAKVHHLKECFGLFAPDPDSPLFEEVAARNAELANEAGFDVMYLDALDGEDVLGGAEWSWHYGARYVHEIWKRLDHPMVMEMSTFHHHLWYVRSRMGAWDCPTRSHKQFISMHLQANEANDRMFLPSNLGWWALTTWGGPQTEPTFSDDIEYLCTKAIATDSGLSIVGYNPASPGQQRMAEIVKRYEAVRHAGKAPEEVKAMLADRTREFRLVSDDPAAPAFAETKHIAHRVASTGGDGAAWRVQNPFEAQAPSVRIEALLSAMPYDAPEAVTIRAATPEAYPDRTANPGVDLQLSATDETTPTGEPAMQLTATNGGLPQTASWAAAYTTFDPALNMDATQAMGVWVHGDGKGAILNFQLHSPPHLSHGIADRWITVDFEGWRTFELIESTTESHHLYAWPYGGAYALYREAVIFGAIESLHLWVNNIPEGETVSCLIGPLRAMPTVDGVLERPTVAIAGVAVELPIDIPTGHYVELAPDGTGALYAPDGGLVSEFAVDGPLPTLPAGDAEVGLRTAVGAGRARVTIGLVESRG